MTVLLGENLDEAKNRHQALQISGGMAVVAVGPRRACPGGTSAKKSCRARPLIVEPMGALAQGGKGDGEWTPT